jgi:hypothetical protein
MAFSRRNASLFPVPPAGKPGFNRLSQRRNPAVGANLRVPRQGYVSALGGGLRHAQPTAQPEPVEGGC